MLLDKSHFGWGIGTAVAFLLATVAYSLHVALSMAVSGGSTVGLAFGTLALICMTLAGLLAVRKSFPTLRLGSAQFWLRGHIWLGLLSGPLTLFHTNFRFGGSLERSLMICYAIVMLSGFYGLILQQFLPRLMKLRIPSEATPQQIPHFCRQLQQVGDTLVEDLARGMRGKPIATATRQESNAVAIRTRPTSAAPSAKKAAAAASPQTSAAQSLAEKLAAAKARARPAHGAAGQEEASATSKPLAGPTAKKISAAKSAAITNAMAPKATPAPSMKTVASNAARAAEAIPNAITSSERAGGANDSTSNGSAYKILLVFYETDVREFLTGDSQVARRHKLAPEAASRQRFRQVASVLPPESIPVLHRLEAICDERRNFLLQLRIHHWLHSWLLIHIPLSAALFVLLAAHVIMALRVVPWSL